MRRHDAHHGESLRFQHQWWENTWSYDKMVWSGQQYCGIHSERSNATLSTTPVRDVPRTEEMVWGSCTAVNQYCVQSTGRGPRLDLWINSSPTLPPEQTCILHISHQIYLGSRYCQTQWATRIRYLQFGMNVSLSWTNRASSSKAPTSSSVQGHVCYPTRLSYPQADPWCHRLTIIASGWFNQTRVKRLKV